MVVPIQNFDLVTEPCECGSGTRDVRVADWDLDLNSGMFGARASREAEILTLRQQLLVLNRRARVRLRNIDRLVLVWLYRLFPSVLDAIAYTASC